MIIFENMAKRCGKTILIETAWKNLKCQKCEEVLILKQDNEFQSIKVCPVCHAKYIYLKKLKHGDN